MDRSDILSLLVALAALISALAAGKAFLERRPSPARRLREMSERRAELSDELQAGLKEARAARRGGVGKRLGGFLGWAGRLRLYGEDETRRMRSRLAQAGWRGRHAATVWMLLRFFAPAVAIAAAALYSHAFLSQVSTAIRVIAVCGCGLSGMLLPGILLSNAAGRRRQAISRAFPDSLDLLVICVEAGLSVEAAMGKVSEESEPGHPLGDEIGLTAAELAFLGDRRTAWSNLAERVDLPAVRSLCTALVQTETYGTPVGQALRVISQESREGRMALAERKAASLPAKLTVPMILFFLPVLFIVIVGPAAIQISHMQ